MFAHGGSAVPLGVYLLRWCGEKENSLAVLYVIFAVGNFLIRGLTRRLRRGSAGTVPWGCKFALADEPRGCRGRAESPCKRHYKATLPKAVPAGGADAPTPARTVGLPHRGGEVLSFEAKESTKESWRHGDSRGGPPRCASRASVCGSPFGAVLDLGSLRSPAGKKPFIAHFAGGARNVARNKIR